LDAIKAGSILCEEKEKRGNVTGGGRRGCGTNENIYDFFKWSIF
jgi:hypothetical protein